MDPLFNINESSKSIIYTIVTEHENYKKLINDGCACPHAMPGITLSNLFHDNECMLNILEGFDGKLVLEIVFSKEDDIGLSNNKISINHSKFGGIKKFKFIEQLKYVMSLYENGYIYFSEEGNSEIPRINTITERSEFYKADSLNFMIWFIDYPSLNKFVKKFYYATVIPTTLLIDFYNNGYKTVDQIRYQEQMNINIESLRIANSSLKEAKEATSLARKTQRASMLLASLICAISLIGSYIIASKVPVEIESEFSDFLDKHLKSIEYNDSVIMQLHREISNSLHKETPPK